MSIRTMSNHLPGGRDNEQWRGRWYVGQAQPQRERCADLHLRQQGFSTFLPLVRKTVRHARRFRTFLAPLFPGYLFVRLDIARDRWSAVNSTFGMVSLIMESDLPKPVPPGVVEGMMAARDDDGLISGTPQLSVGDTVRVVCGPLSGFIGKLTALDENHRVRVLFDILGKDTLVAVDAARVGLTAVRRRPPDRLAAFSSGRLRVLFTRSAAAFRNRAGKNLTETADGRLQAVSAAVGSGVHDRRHWLARNRYQLAIALVVVVIEPGVMWTPDAIWSPRGFASFESTAIGTLVAMLLGAYLRRRMTVYPGTGLMPVVLPAFVVAYTTVILVFFFLRLDYSRLQFASSFILAVLWFGSVSLIEAKLQRDRFLLLPFGQTRSLLMRSEVDWIVAKSPDELPAVITGVVADLRADLPPAWEGLLARAALSGLPVHHWKQVAEALAGVVDIEDIAENNLGSILPLSAYLRLKRLVDLILTLLTLPVTLPLAFAAALAVLICDGRPVLFRQVRVGFHGNRFVMYKFRTMRQGAEEGRPFTAEGDSRVTRLGRLLRRYRIDELPQIINIVRGEMSWIGPRPESLSLAEWYEREVPFYSYRHIVPPGITGWAQVHQGNVGEVKAATAKLRYDFYYIRYFSPWLDILVAAKTVSTLITGFGAR
jgi:lipopolysaccharide/colanic/teichoic acid biosynthesis glycosyltransferase/transcription antitermination factor NusG